MSKVPVTIRLSPEMKSSLQSLAVDNKSITSVITDALEMYLGRVLSAPDKLVSAKELSEVLPVVDAIGRHISLKDLSQLITIQQGK